MYGINYQYNDGNKEPTRGSENCNTNYLFGGYVCVIIFVYPSYYLGQYHSRAY